jgi:hypothetical protein
MKKDAGCKNSNKRVETSRENKSSCILIGCRQMILAALLRIAKQTSEQDGGQARL